MFQAVLSARQIKLKTIHENLMGAKKDLNTTVNHCHENMRKSMQLIQEISKLKRDEESFVRTPPTTHLGLLVICRRIKWS